MRPVERLLREIEADLRATRNQTGIQHLNATVAQALRDVPREAYIPHSLTDSAYQNRPLPIGHAQTISQPFIVALMTQALQPQPTHRVLEVGTGSGYQTAILARLVKEVCTIERQEKLYQAARKRLTNCANVRCRLGDGVNGWPEGGAFDGILVTAAAESVPEQLVTQLAPGGNMVIPVGPRQGSQILQLIQRREAGEITTRDLLPVAFVPLLTGTVT
jgi:protein-L-isoaspartate(D-aspartate) O-methyltransferase